MGDQFEASQSNESEKVKDVRHVTSAAANNTRQRKHRRSGDARLESADRHIRRIRVPDMFRSHAQASAAGRNVAIVGRRVVVRCENCKCVFVPNLPEVAYDTFPSEFFQLYVEQGAGIDLIVDPLFLVPTSSVRRFLDVGCAFGFGVDFATHALGWQATGLEPSELGKLGREVLGIDLQVAYLDERTAIDEPYDLVFSSEVLEHVRDPRAFLAAAVRALSADGVLMLTTPNADHLSADRSVFSQVSILSYPLHCILYARSTLERVLREAGLPHVHIVERQDTLIAMASRAAFSPIDAKLDRGLLRTYLQKRFEQLPKATPAATGFVYRLFKETVN